MPAGMKPVITQKLIPKPGTTPLLKRGEGMSVWRPPFISDIDPYGWTGDGPTAPPAVKGVEFESPTAVVTGRCFHCRAVKEMVNPVVSMNKKNAPTTRGTCPTCGGQIFRLGGVK